MTRTWVALVDAPPEDAERCVRVEGTGEVLATWTGKHHPHPRALAIDPRVVGPNGPAMSVSWTELDENRRPLFDAPEVLQARRVLLRRWPTYGASTLVTDPVRLAGSVVLLSPGSTAQDDPFARLGHPRVLLSQGFFVPIPRPTGPSLERYAGMPWPYDRFPTDVPPTPTELAS